MRRYELPRVFLAAGWLVSLTGAVVTSGPDTPTASAVVQGSQAADEPRAGEVQEHGGVPKAPPLIQITQGPRPSRPALDPAPGKSTTAFDPQPGLPGEFIIRTYLKNTLLTAHDGGPDTVDAVTTTATSIGSSGFERFTLTSVPTTHTTIQTKGGHYLSASGGISPTNGDPRRALQAYVTSPGNIGTAHFKFLIAPHRPHGHTNIARKWPGYFIIQTSSGFYLTAVGGGGQATAAFHTDVPGSSAAKEGERFWVLKCGDLGSGYQYAIRPAGTGSPGQPEQSWLLAHVGTQWKQHVYFAFYNSDIKFIRQGDGSYALGLQLRDKINYITAVGGGGLASGDNLHTDATQVQAWERFKVVDQGDCAYTIQTVGGWYLAVGPRGISTRISDPNAAPSIGYNARFEFVMVGVWQGPHP